MEEKTLMVRNTAGSQVPAPRRHLSIEGLEDLTIEENLILPRRRMVQYSSTIDGRPGRYNNNLTGEIRNALDLVVLKVTPSRAYFDDDRNLVCMSRNGHHVTSGQSCYECEFAAWGENGEPSACSRGYTLVCLNPKGFRTLGGSGHVGARGSVRPPWTAPVILERKRELLFASRDVPPPVHVSKDDDEEGLKEEMPTVHRGEDEENGEEDICQWKVAERHGVIPLVD